MSNLRARLAGMADAESDQLLSTIWKTFQGTEAFGALLLAIEDLIADAETNLLAPGTITTTRHFCAGQVAGLRRLLTTIHASISFNPAQASYTSTAPAGVEDEPPADDSVLY